MNPELRRTLIGQRIQHVDVTNDGALLLRVRRSGVTLVVKVHGPVETWPYESPDEPEGEPLDFADPPDFRNEHQV